MHQPTPQSGPARRPERIRFDGRYIFLEPLNPAKHSEALWNGLCGDTNDAIWFYMSDGPFADYVAFDTQVAAKAASEDPLFFAVVDRATNRAAGRAALLRIDPANRVIDVGSIVYGPALRRSRGATEAIYLFARHVFEELGFRRFEWKCDAANEASRRAAVRLGFTFEGIFRQHMIVKGRNRDTAWFSMLDSEWPERKRAFERWLDPDNFDSAGIQKTKLNPAASRVFETAS